MGALALVRSWPDLAGEKAQRWRVWRRLFPDRQASSRLACTVLAVCAAWAGLSEGFLQIEFSLRPTRPQ